MTWKSQRRANARSDDDIHRGQLCSSKSSHNSLLKLNNTILKACQKGLLVLRMSFFNSTHEHGVAISRNERKLQEREDHLITTRWLLIITFHLVSMSEQRNSDNSETPSEKQSKKRISSASSITSINLDHSLKV
jgi:hypothetical protein